MNGRIADHGEKKFSTQRRKAEFWEVFKEKESVESNTAGKFEHKSKISESIRTQFLNIIRSLPSMSCCAVMRTHVS